MEVLSLLLVFDAVLGGLFSYAIERGGPEDTHHFFILNSTEHGISTAHKN